MVADLVTSLQISTTYPAKNQTSIYCWTTLTNPSLLWSESDFPADLYQGNGLLTLFLPRPADSRSEDEPNCDTDREIIHCDTIPAPRAMPIPTPVSVPRPVSDGSAIQPFYATG